MAQITAVSNLKIFFPKLKNSQLFFLANSASFSEKPHSGQMIKFTSFQYEDFLIISN
jgi:hypothetical protein